MKSLATMRARNYHHSVTAYRVALIRAALIRNGGNRSAAARDLGLGRTHLVRLMRELVVLDAPERLKNKFPLGNKAWKGHKYASGARA